MKLSFHQHIALFWMIGAPGVFAPVIENAKRPDAGAVMAWGVAIVAVMILFTPLLLRCPPFRRWYGRTDALSERQRQALDVGTKFGARDCLAGGKQRARRAVGGQQDRSPQGD